MHHEYACIKVAMTVESTGDEAKASCQCKTGLSFYSLGEEYHSTEIIVFLDKLCIVFYL